MLKRFLMWLGWRLALAHARSRLASCFECAMGYSYPSDLEMKAVYKIESQGIELGYMKENERTVKERPE